MLNRYARKVNAKFAMQFFFVFLADSLRSSRYYLQSIDHALDPILYQIDIEVDEHTQFTITQFKI